MLNAANTRRYGEAYAAKKISGAFIMLKVELSNVQI
jgi:hypothetical protein